MEQKNHRALGGRPLERERPSTIIHPAWQNFVRFCQELGHGEIEKLSIQDGLPVIAQITKQKVKF